MITDQRLSDINKLQGINAEQVTKEERFALNNKHCVANIKMIREETVVYMDLSSLRVPVHPWWERCLH